MNTALNQTQEAFATDSQQGCSSEESTRSQICGLLASFPPRGSRLERRSEQRYPFPYLVQLTPAGPDGTPADGETIAVVGKQISTLEGRLVRLPRLETEIDKKTKSRQAAAGKLASALKQLSTAQAATEVL